MPRAKEGHEQITRLGSVSTGGVGHSAGGPRNYRRISSSFMDRGHRPCGHVGHWKAPGQQGITRVQMSAGNCRPQSPVDFFTKESLVPWGFQPRHGDCGSVIDENDNPTQSLPCFGDRGLDESGAPCGTVHSGSPSDSFHTRHSCDAGTIPSRTFHARSNAAVTDDSGNARHAGAARHSLATRDSGPARPTGHTR